jgi:hypothetical protein
MLQQIIIALLVLAAAGYCVWTFMPMQRRQRLLDTFASHGVLVQAAGRHRRRLAAPGCGNCSAAGQHASMQAQTPRKRS